MVAAPAQPGRSILAPPEKPSSKCGSMAPRVTIRSNWVSRRFRATGVPRDRLFLEERSRDTIGNAVEVVARYLRGVEARPIYLVTSPFHLERALVTFRHVLGFEWQVQAVAAEDTDDDRKRANSETTYLQETFAFFEGIRPGDMAAIDKKYRARQVR